VVTGIAGSGKSTLSRALSAKTGLPVIHLDIHFWKPGWVEPTEDEWREKQRDLITHDKWILDGNYDATLDLRLERADSAVFLDTSRLVCVGRALVRWNTQASRGLPAARRLGRLGMAPVAGRMVTCLADLARPPN